MSDWDPEHLPDLHDRTFVVTGGNSGLGFFTADQIAAAGAHVVIACRSAQRARTALAVLRSRTPVAHVESIALDTTDAASVDAAADTLLGLPRIDALILNAGTTDPPKRRSTTSAGDELTLAANVLGHVRLVGRALGAVAASGGRVVALGSLATRLATLDLDDLQSRRGYRPFRTYARSKIALETFAFELDRRLRAAGSAASSLVAQPGYALDSLAPRIDEINEPSLGSRLAEGALRAFAQGKDRGAWPTVRAAADPHAAGGEYYGPARRTKGHPVRQTPVDQVVDERLAGRLWERLEQLAGVPVEP